MKKIFMCNEPATTKYVLLSIFFSVVFFVWSLDSVAALDLELTQGLSGALPIAVVPFAGQFTVDNPNSQIASIIRRDLHNSGRFNALPATHIHRFPSQLSAVDAKYWRRQKVDNVVIGSIQSLGHSQYRVNFKLLDLYGGVVNHGGKHANGAKVTVLAKHSYDVNASQLRQLAHHISDIIYEKLTGVRGVFSTRIAYVLVNSLGKTDKEYRLEVADMDGFNARSLLVSRAPIMSPAWSKDGKQIAYVSFEGHRSAIFVQQLKTGKRVRIAAFSGINGAPAWSPDGKRLALVLTKTGSPKIYIMDLASRRLKQITHGWSIDTEPAWSPTGQSIVFTSNRGGSPQVYQLDIQRDERGAKRLTFEGDYNVHASFTKDGKRIALLHKETHLFTIAILHPYTGKLDLLTRQGMYDSPSIAPNGSMVLYAARQGGRGVLSMVSTDGRVKLRLPARQGDVQSPAWSPY